jgi:hypothetical protein
MALFTTATRAATRRTGTMDAKENPTLHWDYKDIHL